MVHVSTSCFIQSFLKVTIKNDGNLRLLRRITATKVKETSSADRQHQPRAIHSDKFKKIGVDYCSVPMYRRASKCAPSFPGEFFAAVYCLDSIRVRDRWNWEHQGNYDRLVAPSFQGSMVPVSPWSRPGRIDAHTLNSVSIQVQPVGKVFLLAPDVRQFIRNFILIQRSRLDIHRPAPGGCPCFDAGSFQIHRGQAVTRAYRHTILRSVHSTQSIAQCDSHNRIFWHFLFVYHCFQMAQCGTSTRPGRLSPRRRCSHRYQSERLRSI